MNLKVIAKKSRLLFWANSKFKSYQLKRDLAHLTRNYTAKAHAKNFVYAPREAAVTFKLRRQLYHPAITERSPENRCVLSVGARQS